MSPPYLGFHLHGNRFFPRTKYDRPPRFLCVYSTYVEHTTAPVAAAVLILLLQYSRYRTGVAGRAGGQIIVLTSNITIVGAVGSIIPIASFFFRVSNGTNYCRERLVLRGLARVEASRRRKRVPKPSRDKNAFQGASRGGEGGKEPTI